MSLATRPRAALRICLVGRQLTLSADEPRSSATAVRTNVRHPRDAVSMVPDGR